MNESFRLSRIRAPRGTLVAMALVALVFVLFGLAANALAPDQAAANPAGQLNGLAVQLGHWLLGHV